MTEVSSGSGLRIAMISLHGLIRAHDAELGRDADTGGQIKYVLELAAELGRHPEVSQVELLTRQICDDRVGPDYAQLEEPISENAKIVRIPFGPKRYLRKEALWPYMEVFIDQTLNYFRRSGLPDLIHGHYADAGYGGAQLARLLHLPFVFTGHSLGRIKKQRLLDLDSEAANLEETYRFTTRAEAEEMAMRSYGQSAQVGEWCRRNWLTLRETRRALGDPTESEKAALRAEECVLAPPPRY